MRVPDLTAYDISVTTTSSGSLFAEVQDLPGCFAAGENVEALTQALLQAIVLHLDDHPDDPAHYTHRS